MRREVCRTYDDFKDEATAGKRVVYASDIGILEDHHRSRARPAQAKAKLSKPQFRCAAHVGQRLPFCNLVRDGWKYAHFEGDD
ncbi:MAG TPA: hypothetical protein VGC79_12355 [Polyangiaceae bacterium]